MRDFRIRYRKRGRHYHLRVFSAPQPGATYAKLGDLTLDEDDWLHVRELFTGRVALRSDDLPFSEEEMEEADWRRDQLRDEGGEP